MPELSSSLVFMRRLTAESPLSPQPIQEALPRIVEHACRTARSSEEAAYLAIEVFVSQLLAIQHEEARTAALIERQGIGAEHLRDAWARTVRRLDAVRDQLCGKPETTQEMFARWDAEETAEQSDPPAEAAAD